MAKSIVDEDSSKSKKKELNPAIAMILKEFQYSSWNNPRIQSRKWLKRYKLTDTQITSLRRKAVKIWAYIVHLMDFKESLEYAEYDLRTSYNREVEELEKVQDELCKMVEDIIVHHTADPNVLPAMNTSSGNEFNASGDAIREQAKQLSTQMRERLDYDDEKKADFGKMDPLVYHVLKEFYSHSNWNHPRIERESLKGRYTDAQITTARKKALMMWPYVRLIMNLGDQPKGTTFEDLVEELYMIHMEEIKLLKRNNKILLRRIEELLKYNSVMNEMNSKGKGNGS